jgi:hypothetical protein
MEDFPNPERGFYHPLGTRAGKHEVLSLERLKGLLKSVTVRGASYAVVSSLIYRGYLLDSFVHASLPGEFLADLEKDFATIRMAGLKCIIRFAYVNSVKHRDCTDAEKICPPYGDAPKNIVLKHIAQLKPILVKNADVIAAVQMGFIGIWGENYYTDYFGDASMNGPKRILDSSWRDRNQVLKALLDAIPKDRMVQVRTPQIKQRYVYGVTAPVSSSPLNIKNAYKNTDESRIGFHNDCFLASTDDYGTYYDYGNSSSTRKAANAELRNYFSNDSRFVVVGGETCDDAFSPQNDCAPAGAAEKEFSQMHYSYLNAAYNVDVNNDWQTDGCMDNIKRKLGYRIALRSGTYPSTVQKTGTLHISIQLENIGYAAPYNPRPVQLLLRDVNSGKSYSFDFKVDPRYWFTGAIKLGANFKLPIGVQPGKYELLLNLPDKYPSIAGRPEYSIRLANEHTWEEQTGFNKLNHILIVE